MTPPGEINDLTPVTHGECFHNRALLETRMCAVEAAVVTMTKNIETIMKKMDGIETAVNRVLWIAVLILVGVVLGRGLDFEGLGGLV